MTEKNLIVEIGRGEDTSIDWDFGFEILNDIDAIILDYELVGKPINKNALIIILDELSDIVACVPDIDNFHEAFDLIKSCAWVEQKFFDPDMPTSSFWKKITVKKTDMASLLLLVNRAEELFQQLYEKDGIKHLITKIIEKNETKSKLTEEKKSQSQRQEFETQVKRSLLQIEKIFKKKSGIHYHDPFLINRDEGVVFVLTVHTSYRKIRSELEKKITALLKTRHKVYEIVESSPTGSGYIPYFAGNQRLKEMGWTQNKSKLFHKDKAVLEIANKSRLNYVKKINNGNEA